MEEKSMWGYLITDYTVIPREYMIVDHEAVQQTVQKLGERANIPGVRPYRQEIVSHLANEAREMVYIAKRNLSAAQRLYSILSEMESCFVKPNSGG